MPRYRYLDAARTAVVDEHGDALPLAAHPDLADDPRVARFRAWREAGHEPAPCIAPPAGGAREAGAIRRRLAALDLQSLRPLGALAAAWAAGRPPWPASPSAVPADGEAPDTAASPAFPCAEAEFLHSIELEKDALRRRLAALASAAPAATGPE